MAHTIGPWWVVGTGESHNAIAECGGFSIECPEDVELGDEKDDAHMLAASLAMCDALKPFAYLAQVMEPGQFLQFRGVYISYEQAVAAQNAIAKAKGEPCN